MRSIEILYRLRPSGANRGFGRLAHRAERSNPARGAWNYDLRSALRARRSMLGEGTAGDPGRLDWNARFFLYAAFGPLPSVDHPPSRCEWGTAA
jgi:hypothetical protein